jgi:predicted nucleic acid-binding protein
MTGYLIALESADDQHHDAAIRHWNEFIRQRPELVTTSFVLDEVVTFFVTRGRHAKGVEIAERLLQSSSVQVEHVNEELFLAAFEFLKTRRDKGFSRTDCVSFVLMDRFSIRGDLAFDGHFEQAGFTRLPLARR